MFKFLVFSALIFSVSECNLVHSRIKRQYWGGSPYYGNSQYYETQPQQWSSQYQNNQNYYSPYFYGYQHQHTWQSSNQNSYPSQYNRPSWISENSNGYATAPPNYNTGSYARPKYLSTMQPKPTLAPVVLERSTVFVTQQPEVLKSAENENEKPHPTFLQRLGVPTFPIVPTLTSSEEEELKSAEETLKSAEEESLKNGELLPERETSTTSENIPEETTLETTTELSETSAHEGDKIASSEFFASSTEFAETTAPETTTFEVSTVITETSAETTTQPAESSSIETTIPTTTKALTTTTALETTTTSQTKDVKPVTLLAFQEVTNEVTSNPVNVTQPTVDQNTGAGDVNETGEGSGAEPDVNSTRSTFSTGIVGLRSPPLPKPTDPEKVGIEVVEWTDSDNEVRKALLTQ